MLDRVLEGTLRRAARTFPALLVTGLPPQLYYWRSRDGLEVDVLVEYDGRLYPFEIKSTSTPTPLHAATLKKWTGLARDVGERATLLADIPAAVTLESGVRAVPWWWV